MNICAIICEFNPFHNGHKYLLEMAKKLSGCDAVLCVMSGSFTQRGDICIADKFTRARHAVLGGADCVIGLPAAFTVAPAEIFAAGAIKIINSVPDIKYLAFGCEDSSSDFFEAAKLMLDESELFKTTLKRGLSRGKSYIKSYAEAFESCGGAKEILSSPNNILGAEYCKAILRTGSGVAAIPVQRIGSGFADENLSKNYSSAAAIRKNICNPSVADSLPGYVYGDLKDFSAEQKLFGELLAFKSAIAESDGMKKIFGCTEGLENKIQSCAGLPYEKLISATAGRRYSSSRVRRILLANLLGLYEEDAMSFLDGNLYLRPLAVKKQSADNILPALSKSPFPVIYKKRDLPKLCKTAEKCFEKDQSAYKIWNFIFKRPVADFGYMITV